MQMVPRWLGIFMFPLTSLEKMDFSPGIENTNVFLSGIL